MNLSSNTNNIFYIFMDELLVPRCFVQTAGYEGQIKRVKILNS